MSLTLAESSITKRAYTNEELNEALDSVKENRINSYNLYNTWVEGGPAGCEYDVSPSGWMGQDQFYRW